jgi:steroid delta-isomerase
VSHATIDALVAYYEKLDRESLGEMGRYYAAECYFKDPFNEVRTLPEIQAIFERMYRHLADPRFRVTERIEEGKSGVLVWDFDFRMRAWQPATARRIHGVTLLKFDAAGKVNYHRDYWDAAEELYEKLPLIGPLMRGLRRYVR